MKKLLAIIIIGSIAITGNVFADDDCNLILENGIEGTVQHYKVLEYKTVLPEQAFRRALSNLKTYCCIKARDCTNEKNLTKEELYPKSAFLFDHLFDVTMRRLDGVEKLAYGLEVDIAGKTRREYINKVASDPNGAQAMELEAKYKEYRTLHTKDTNDINHVIKNFSKENNKATLSLADKYNKVCEIIKTMYEGLQKESIIIWSKFETKSFLKKCDNLVAYRVSQENSNVKLLMIKKSSQLLDKVTKAYTQKYFVEEKLMWLQALISKVKDMFQTVVQQSAASKICSK